MARGGSREKVAIIERQIQALDLRKEGWTYRQIAKHLDISVGLAFKYIQDELDSLAQLKTESADSVRLLELERVDMLMKGLAPMALVGNIGAVTAYLKCMERRAKLLGLDAPTKIAPTNPDGTEPFSLEIKAVEYRNLIPPPIEGGSIPDSDPSSEG